MPETAESLAANLKSRRNVTIEITNHTHSYCLIDPRIHLESGHCHSPPQPTIRPLKTEVCNFTKSKGQAEGAVGLLTYDLFQRGGSGANLSVAIMFSVPYDFSGYKNWFGLAIQQQSVKCDAKLFKHMYYDKEMTGFSRQEASGCVLTYEGKSLDLMGTMSPLGRAMMKVELWEKLFNPPQNQGPY